MIRIDRKGLGITHKDFERIYPKVCKGLGETAPLLENKGMVTDYEPCIALQTVDRATGAAIFAKVSEEYVRKIGALKFPYVQAAFWFLGLSGEEAKIFMKRFDMAFQKGGG